MSSSNCIRLQIVGAAGGYPYAGHACSGYLLGLSDKNLLLDCGSGVAARLLADREAISLDAIIISHLHYDHIWDIVPLGYAIMAEWLKHKMKTPVPLYVPEGGKAFLANVWQLLGHKHWTFKDEPLGEGYDALKAAAAEGRDWMWEVFDVTEFSAGDTLSLASDSPINVETIGVVHTPEAVGMRVEHQGRCFVYTGDTRFTEALIQFARDADLLLAEGHFSGSEPPGGAHMSPKEAATLAQKARAKHLVLTHLADPADKDLARISVREAYAGPISIALDCGVIEP